MMIGIMFLIHEIYIIILKKYKVLYNKQFHRIQEEYFRLIFELPNYPI